MPRAEASSVAAVLRTASLSPGGSGRDCWLLCLLALMEGRAIGLVAGARRTVADHLRRLLALAADDRGTRLGCLGAFAAYGGVDFLSSLPWLAPSKRAHRVPGNCPEADWCCWLRANLPRDRGRRHRADFSTRRRSIMDPIGTRLAQAGRPCREVLLTYIVRVVILWRCRWPGQTPKRQAGRWPRRRRDSPKSWSAPRRRRRRSRAMGDQASSWCRSTPGSGRRAAREASRASCSIRRSPAPMSTLLERRQRPRRRPVSYLLDTNVISEVRRPKPEGRVLNWLDAAIEDEMFLSVVTVAELARGIAQMEEGKRRRALAAWLDQDLPHRFGERLLSIDAETALIWGRLMAQSRTEGRALVSWMDGSRDGAAAWPGACHAQRQGLQRARPRAPRSLAK